MSASYKPVGWNRNKLVYDAVLGLAVVGYVLIFIHLSPLFVSVGPLLDEPTIRMRAFGSCAFLLLTFILCIGPLARLDARFLPLLYNRRHFGVLTSVVALTHASHVLGWYFSFSPVDPYVALLSANASYSRLAGFPFEILGVVALFLLGVLATTSHDFWLAFLTPPVWKAIHMSLYLAYACVVAHVALGAMTMPYGAPMGVVVAIGALSVAGLHILAGRRGASAEKGAIASGDWAIVGPPDRVAEGRGIVVPVAGTESIAIFRHGGRFSAMANACAHQNGPLGEGRIIDGCVTCPWHGFQYRPEDGVAPPPFTERLATYRLKIENGLLCVDTRALPPGTFVEPLTLSETAA